MKASRAKAEKKKVAVDDGVSPMNEEVDSEKDLDRGAYAKQAMMEGKRIYGDTIPSHRPDARIVVIKQGIGTLSIAHSFHSPESGCGLSARARFRASTLTMAGPTRGVVSCA